MKSRIILLFSCIPIFLLASCGKTSQEQVRNTSIPTPTTLQTKNSTPTIPPSHTQNPTSTQTPSTTPTATPTPSNTPFLFESTPLIPLHNVKSNHSLVRLRQIQVPSKYSAIVYFSPHHPVMYFTGAGLLVKRLDLTSNEYLPDLLGPVNSSPGFLATSPDDLLIAGSDMNRILVWDLHSDDPIHILEPTLNTLRGVLFIDNDILVTIDYDGNIIQWDRWSWEEIARTELHQEQKRVIFVPSGDGALILDDVEGVLPVVDLDGRPLSSIELPSHSYRFISVSQDGKRLMIQEREGVRVYEIVSGEEVHFLSLEGLRNVAITPNWSLIAASDADHNVLLIDPSNGDYLLTQKLDVSVIRSLAISPGGNLLGLYVISPDQKTPYIELWGLVGESDTN
jgi:WD40 repeat protein